MNVQMVRYLTGMVMKFEAIMLLIPCGIALIYSEQEGYAYLITAAFGFLAGTLVSLRKPKNTFFYAKEGFVTVALCWIVLSAIGALPFTISGEIPHYIDALFETISGFTTTGASILSDVEALSKTSLFWRSFTHWIGGMGVLVFILAIIPLSGGQSIYLLRAESTGPSVGKLVPRLKATAKILYLIYLGMTLLMILMLICGGMPIFDSFCTAFGTAGTGGFGIYNNSIAAYSSYYLQITITVFMFLFGVNFNIYYLILAGKFREVLHNEELRWYIGIMVTAIITITFFIRADFTSFGQALNAGAFQVSSIMTSTGFSTVDFNKWPVITRTILIILMFIGACAGSTGGGIKVSRFIIFIKSMFHEVGRLIHPRSVKILKMNKKKVDDEVVRLVSVYFASFIVIFIASLLIISIDGFDMVSNFSAVAATINNIGPGLEVVGPTGNFGSYSILSKIVLLLDMLIGRLEIFPVLLLCSPRTWINR